MKLPSFTILALLSATTVLPVDSSSAGEFFFSHRQKTRTQTKLRKHNYSQNVWPFTTPSTFGATEIAVAQTDPTANGAIVKPFHFRANDLTVNHLILDQVGLSLYKTGKLIASGRIYHTGGAGELIGNNVTVRIRAYISHTAAEAPVISEPILATTTASATDVPAAVAGDADGGSPSAEADAELDRLERLAALAERLTPNPTTPTTPTEAIETLRAFRAVLKSPAVADEGPAAIEEVATPIATPNEVNRIPPDAYRVWSSERKFWVSRGRPQHVSLVDPVDRFEDQAVLRQHFDDITHLEVELEYQRDR